MEGSEDDFALKREGSRDRKEKKKRQRILNNRGKGWRVLSGRGRKTMHDEWMEHKERLEEKGRKR